MSMANGGPIATILARDIDPRLTQFFAALDQHAQRVEEVAGRIEYAFRNEDRVTKLATGVGAGAGTTLEIALEAFPLGTLYVFDQIVVGSYDYSAGNLVPNVFRGDNPSESIYPLGSVFLSPSVRAANLNLGGPFVTGEPVSVEIPDADADLTFILACYGYQVTAQET